MEEQTYNAMIVEETAPKTFERRIGERCLSDLPDGDVLIAVRYSALNYKDALSATGNKGVTRQYPHTPGIDASGVVAASESADFTAGSEVIVTSYDLGMNTAGGFGQFIRVPAGWVVPRPDSLSLEESMVLGTAGFTAGLGVYHLERGGVTPESGVILVTGATGGVGSLAVAILAKIGYRVAAVSGKPEAGSFLRDLGAQEVLSREEATDTSGRPLLTGRWAGVIDTVGGDMLATALKAAQPEAVVTCCGLVASPELNTTVFPFILRGASLVGIDSQNCPMPIRAGIWQRLAADWKPDGLAGLGRRVALKDLDPEIDTILRGGITGRVVVDLTAE
jgi:acrylyl-CoA reductase (NADPH)